MLIPAWLCGASLDATALREQAAAGDAGAQVELGKLLRSGGDGVAKSPKEALTWFRLAAGQGNIDGQVFLAQMLILGEGIKANTVEGSAMAIKAAGQGDPRAQMLMMALCSRGAKGIEKNPGEAFRWAQLAANQNHVGAMRAAGTMLIEGFGTKADRDQGVTWFRKAAELGDVEAQSLLGGWYVIGQYGVLNDDAEAVRWLRPAAEHGHRTAMEQYGALLSGGRGTERNVLEGCAWMWLGASLGKKADQERGFRNLEPMVKNGLVSWEQISARSNELLEEIRARLRPQGERPESGESPKSQTEPPGA